MGKLRIPTVCNMLSFNSGTLWEVPTPAVILMQNCPFFRLLHVSLLHRIFILTDRSVTKTSLLWRCWPGSAAVRLFCVWRWPMRPWLRTSKLVKRESEEREIKGSERKSKKWRQWRRERERERERGREREREREREGERERERIWREWEGIDGGGGRYRRRSVCWRVNAVV